MSTPTEPYFARLITECRSAFNRSRTGLLYRLGLRRPFDGVAGQLRSHYQLLARRGRVVWGATAQVNVGMFSGGGSDLPGVTVYSADGYYDACPQDLATIGRACFEFKNTDPVDAEFRKIAKRLTDEFDQTVRMQVPRRLSDGRDVLMGATMFHRARLPGGILQARVFPLVIAPELTEINMVLPLTYWPSAISAAWGDLQSKLEAEPVTSSAHRVARDAEKRPFQHTGPNWDVEAIPIQVTPAMAKELTAQAGGKGLKSTPMLAIGLSPDGMRTAGLVTTHDPHTEIVFTSNGVKVVVRKDQLQRLRGTIVDFKSSAFDAGVVIRLPGE